MPATPAPTQPTADPRVALADRCVQCGLCLPACPTYAHDQLEAESPRGRIALMRHWALGAAPTPLGGTHLDHCLACRRCEAVCPAGVEYGALLLASRAAQRTRGGAGLRPAVIEWLTARPAWLSRLLALYRRVALLLPRRWRPLPIPPAPGPGLTDAPPGAVALFIGCAATAYEPPVRDALARLLAAAGASVNVPEQQTCCGSLHAHAGDDATADRLAAQNRDAFENCTTVLTLASGCHGALAAAIPSGTQVVDALAWLDARGDRLAFHPLHERIALHLPCTQRGIAGSVTALRRLLARIPGLRVIELDAGFGCCGAAGMQMLTDPARAASYRDPLLAQVQAIGATRLLSANLGCRLHLANAATVPVQHPLELLAAQLAPPPSPGPL